MDTLRRGEAEEEQRAEESGDSRRGGERGRPGETSGDEGRHSETCGIMCPTGL